MKTVKAILTFPPSEVEKPITSHLIKDYDLWVNILHAEIAPTRRGKLVVNIQGSEENIGKGMDYLREEGVGLQLLNGGILVSDEKCVHCGLCTATCPSGALSMDPDTWALVFQKEKCFLCQSCVKACPVRAISVMV